MVVGVVMCLDVRVAQHLNRAGGGGEGTGQGEEGVVSLTLNNGGGSYSSRKDPLKFKNSTAFT